ncbi:ZEBRA protein [macacine gammaherpesvirus 13]|uniref:ZEBRA protein n=1 Tax=macacine gammaherpesvirus 13 TaxID=2341050 RepID=A0A3G1T4F3_9GAMA|nr:ZEBRA protein [Macaca arctoides gammaherpesvirus 1]AYA49824.1 ZEBRA protein [Macaca arctoides gammaherpesvirus 1]
MDPGSPPEDVKYTPDPPYQVPFPQAFDAATRVYQDLGGPSQQPTALPCVLWPVLPEPLPQGQQTTAYHVSAAPTGQWLPAFQPNPENLYQAYGAPQLLQVSDLTQIQPFYQAGGEAPQPGDNSTAATAAAAAYACPGADQDQQQAEVEAPLPRPAPVATPPRRPRRTTQPETLEECGTDLEVRRFKNRLASRKCRAKFKTLLQQYREVAAAKSKENERLRLLLKQMCPSLEVDSIIPRTPDILHEELI